MTLAGLLASACFNPSAVDDTTAATTTATTTTGTPETTAPTTTAPAADASTSADLPTTTTACDGACATATTSPATTDTTGATTAPDTTTGSAALGFTPQPPIALLGALDLATVDLDADARHDLAITSMTAPQLAYVLGKDLAVPVLLPAAKSFPILGLDADTDGARDDLALGYWTDAGSLHVLRNTGAVTFDDHSAALGVPCTRPLAIAAGFLDADEVLDYVVTCAEFATGYYYVPGDKTTYLSMAVVAVEIGIRPTFVHLLDVFGSPALDLIAPHHESSTLFVYEGNGDGSFSTLEPLSYAVPAAATLDIGDIDGDERLDLAVIQLETDDCSLLLGLPGAGFAQPADFVCGPQVRDITLGDFNKDGATDLATIHLDQKLRIAENLGDGTFVSTLNYAIGPSAWRVVVGDYDGSGSLDLAITTLDELTFVLNDL